MDDIFIRLFNIVIIIIVVYWLYKNNKIPQLNIFIDSVFKKSGTTFDNKVEETIVAETPTTTQTKNNTEIRCKNCGSIVIKFLENYADDNVFRSLCRDVLKGDLNIIANRNTVLGNPLGLDSKHLTDEVKG